jgi:DNA-binding CsgD family transcriptional regulator
MAGALGGEARRLESVVFTACRAIVTCSQAFEVDRARQWIRASEEFIRRYGAVHLYTTCRAHYGGLLFGQGKWDEAEVELRSALHIGVSAERAVYGEALAKLAELRIAQGNLEEAAELLRGFEDHFAAAHPWAQIHLRRGEPERAATILDRQLDSGEQCLDWVPMCELRVEVDLALGDVGLATARAAQLAEFGRPTKCLAVAARCERAYGRVRLAAGAMDEAVRHLGRALDACDRLDLRYEAGRTHLLLARAFGEGRRTNAVAEARAALDAFDRLGATADGDESAAYLRELGVRAARTGRRGTPTLTPRESEVLALLAHGMSNREVAERLFLTRKTVEHHVRSVLGKLGVSNRAEAAAYAVRHQPQA